MQYLFFILLYIFFLLTMFTLILKNTKANYSNAKTCVVINLIWSLKHINTNCWINRYGNNKDPLQNSRGPIFIRFDWMQKSKPQLINYNASAVDINASDISLQRRLIKKKSTARQYWNYVFKAKLMKWHQTESWLYLIYASLPCMSIIYINS